MFKLIFVFITFVFLYSQDFFNLNDYTLYWHDEFNSSSLNLNNWNYKNLGKRKLGFNIKKNIIVKNGILCIKINKKNKKVFAGMISTKNKFETKFGYFEIRAKLPQKKGIQASFWLQSNLYGKKIGNYKKSGTEIDIFEYVSKYPNKIFFNIHWDGYKKYHKYITHYVKYLNIQKGWHTFGILWTKKNYYFFIDRKLIYKLNFPISNTNEYIILSLEHTKWSGKMDENITDKFLIDYVRVYKKKERG